MVYSETHIPMLLVKAGKRGGGVGLVQGVQVHSNENNRLKQQAPEPKKNSLMFCRIPWSEGACIYMWVLVFICSWSGGVGGREARSFPGREQDYVYLF